MLRVPGYEVHEQIHRGPRFQLFQATRITPRRRVVLKVLAPGVPPSTSLARLQHELDVAGSLHSPHLARYVRLERHEEGGALVAEDLEGRSLEELLAGDHLPVELSLQIGVQVAAGLLELHAHDVIHRGIHPGNILVERARARALVVDFSEASPLEDGRAEAPRLEDLAMPLAYVSPEQTGRLSRPVDRRTDFYSLGATLYHALAGRPPFEGSDPLALVHAHIARPHVSLAEVVDLCIPRQVARVVDKLLAKNPEDRYQTAGGLLADLTECLVQLQSTGVVADFALGRHDLAPRFRPADKIYGRSEERAALMRAHAEVTQGAKVLLLVAGEPGVGKSSLVSELRKSIHGRRELFVAGKFDQLQRHAPYAALGEALDALCRGLLGMPDDELAAWRARILALTSGNAGLIVDIVHSLAAILGPQPPVPEAGLVEAKHRFDLTLGRFLSAFAREGQPLVLFLDDLQWADPATLLTVEALMAAPQPTHLLVIGAYRSNEVDGAHPLSLALDRLRAASVDIRTVALSGLSVEDVTELLGDALHAEPEDVRALAKLAVERTSGNPYFVDEFLRALDDEKVLRFSEHGAAGPAAVAPEIAAPALHDRASWWWDDAAIERLGLTANVTDLVVRKLGRLPSGTQEALRLAACLGSRFDLALLAEAAGVSSERLIALLAPATRDRMVVPLGAGDPGAVDTGDGRGASSDGTSSYRFLHDRVQQAAYESIPHAQRAALHVHIGRILLARARGEAPAARVFDIVDHLMRGLTLVTERDERLVTATLLLEAGARARKTAAYSDAFEYLSAGISLLTADAWEANYPLASELHVRGAECAYLAGRLEAADLLSDAILPKLRTPVERAELLAIRFVLEANRGNYERSLALGREALEALGHPVPSLRTTIPLLSLRVRASLALGWRDVARIADLPTITDPVLDATISVLSKLMAPAYLGDPTLFDWVVHEGVRLTLRHGLTAMTAQTLADYSIFLVSRGDYDGALAFGRLGVDLVERTNAVACRAHVYAVVAMSPNAYARNHVRTSIPLALRAIDAGLQSGDVLFTCYAATTIPELMFIVGDSIDAVIADAEMRELSIRGFHYDDMTLELRMFRQCMRCLRGETSSRGSLSSADVDEDALVAEVTGSSATLARGNYVLFKTVTLSIMGESRAALALIRAHDSTVETSMAGMTALTEYVFHACLSLVDGLRDPALPREGLRALLRKKMAALARWAASAPVNFRHKHLLVLAEVRDHEGRPDEAARLYDESIRDATAWGYEQNAAIAAERAGMAFARRGRDVIARTYLVAARAGYARWGARGKVRAIDEDHPGCAPAPPRTVRGSDAIDMLGVFRAAQALSSEIALPALLESILRVIVQTAGARRACLLVDGDGALRIEARFDGDTNAVDVAGSRVEGSEAVSEAIVRYTLRSGEDVVLADAGREGAFTRDPYVVSHRSRSLLCMPVRNRDRVVGALFLENELTPNAFTHERLELLRILLAQAAISLENARLYDATQKLNVELRDGEARLRQILESLPVGVYVVDAAGRPTFMNRIAEDILGQGPGEPDRWERAPILRALQGERVMVDDVEVRRPDRTIPLAVWGTPVRDESGAVRDAILAFQDISPLRAAEADRAQLEEHLRQSERLESIGRLAGGVAHDFNNFLTPILLFSELGTRSAPAEGPLRVQLGQIHDAAERAAALTRQLLAFGRREVLDAQVLDVNQMLRGFESMLRRLVRENVELSLVLHPEPCWVRADASQLQRVVMNLAMNAADAMAQGGQLTIRTQSTDDLEGARTTDAPAALGPCVVIEVTDTGRGIDEETLPKIFEPFFTTKEPGHGTGLGLPTVYGLVKQHGGHVRVHSVVGRGTSFEAFVPRVAAGEEVASSSSSAPPPGVPAGRGQVILVVEDDAAVRAVVVEVLRGDGYEVLDAASGAEATALALSCGRDLDLLVTDVVMPGMNGRDLLAALRREQPWLAAIYMSGYSADVISAHGLLHADVDLLHKPFSADALRGKVESVLARRRRR